MPERQAEGSVVPEGGDDGKGLDVFRVPMHTPGGRGLAPVLTFCIALSLLAACRLPSQEEGNSSRGDRIVTSVRSEPRTFDPLFATDYSSSLISHLVHAKLLRVNRRTWQVEPQLAESWYPVDSKRTVWHVRLRGDVRWSDGTRFSAEDVLHTLGRAYEDPKVAVRRALLVSGKPARARKLHELMIELILPEPVSTGLKMLDSLPILPAHASTSPEPSEQAASNMTAIAQIGLGPYLLQSYRPGQYMLFQRNPNYWNFDHTYPSEILVNIVPDQDSELLRLVAGASDFIDDGVRPTDMPTLRPLIDSRTLRMYDIGPSLDTPALWFNLNPDRSPKSWWHSREFRRGVSHAVDRSGFVNAVYLGLAIPATGPITEAYGNWHLPDAPLNEFDLSAARNAFSSIGILDRNGDGRLEDSSGRVVEFGVMVPSSNQSLIRGAQFIRDSLSGAGITVHVIPMEVGALINRILRGEYEAAYYVWNHSEPDPESSMEFWRSSGSFHVWNPGQRTPSTTWERDLDALYAELSDMVDETERQAAFKKMQLILRREMPLICFAAPRLAIVVSSRLDDVTPAQTRPHLLWSPESLKFRAPGTGQERKSSHR
jgi:peptide/nickel transport system substrate-binding protein